MNNIEKLSAALIGCPAELKSELNYQLDIPDRENEEGESYTLADAFKDTWDNAESWGTAKKLLNQCNDVAVKCGYYVPVDISTVIVSRGKPYAYKKGGIHYECAESWGEWIKK